MHELKNITFVLHLILISSRPENLKIILLRTDRAEILIVKEDSNKSETTLNQSALKKWFIIWEMCRNFQSSKGVCGSGSQVWEGLPVMGTITGHIGLCQTIYLPWDNFRFLDSIAELLRKWWPVLDSWYLTEGISMLLQYSIKSNLQYPTGSFISRGEM